MPPPLALPPLPPVPPVAPAPEALSPCPPLPARAVLFWIRVEPVRFTSAPTADRPPPKALAPLPPDCPTPEKTVAKGLGPVSPMTVLDWRRRLPVCFSEPPTRAMPPPKESAEVPRVPPFLLPPPSPPSEVLFWTV